MLGINPGHFPEWEGVLKTPGNWQPFLDAAKPFGVIRFMDWQQTNRRTPEYQPQVNVADLPKASDNWWSNGVPWHLWRGVPIEVCVDVANMAGARPWICIPHLATNDLINHIVSSVIGRSATRPIFEFSNEIWNSSFFQQRDCAERGRYLDNRPLHAAIQYQALRTRAISWYTHGQADVAISGQTTNAWVARELMKLAGDKVQALAIAPYFGRPEGDYKYGPTTAHVSWHAENYIDQRLKPAITEHAVLAETYGVKLWAYEAGQHLMADPKNNAQVWSYDWFNRSQLAASAYYRLFDRWNAAGGDLLCLYSLASEYSHEYWGLNEIVGGKALKTLPKALAAAGWLNEQREKQ